MLRTTFRPRVSRVRIFACALAAACIAAALAPSPARAQFFEPDQDVPGVWIENDGNLKSRQVSPDKELAGIRARAKSAAAAAKDEKLSFVSLPKLIAEARSAQGAGKEVPNDVRFMGGLTQVRYVFVYPEEKDVVIAGPAEAFSVHGGGMYAFGKLSRRPVMQLDDFVVALRTAYDPRGRAFGCRIDPDPKSVDISADVMKRFAKAGRKERMDAMQRELGPQKVSVFGTPADTRLAFVLVAADYKLKRFAMGLEPAASAPGVQIGHAVDNTRSAMNRFWFETDYEPLRVSADGNAYELRGRRVKVLAGAFSFDPRGATEKAMAFAKKFTERMAAVAVAEPLVAEIQNVADLSMVASLIRYDKLDKKAGWDVAPLLEESGYAVKKVPVAATADTLVGATSGSIVAGGVMFKPGQFVSECPRTGDDGGALEQSRQQAKKLRKERGDAPVVPAT